MSVVAMPSEDDAPYCYLCRKGPALPGYQFCAFCWSAIERKQRPMDRLDQKTNSLVSGLSFFGGFCLFGITAFCIVAWPGYWWLAGVAEAAFRSERLDTVLPSVFGLSPAQALPLGLAAAAGLGAGTYGALHALEQAQEEGIIPRWACAGFVLCAFTIGSVLGYLARVDS